MGKSTLFNRITNSRRSIVTAIAGTTRDVSRSRLSGRELRSPSSTPAECSGSQDPLHELVVIAGRRAIESAQVVVFVVDGRDGLVPRPGNRAAPEAGVPVLMAVNKTDDKRARGRAEEFYRLGSNRSWRLPPSTRPVSGICWTR